MNLKRLLPYLASLVLILLPSIVFAQSEPTARNFFGPIIPPECTCATSAPGWGCVLQVIQNIWNLAITVGVFAVTAAILYSGWLMLMTPFSAEGKKKGKEALKNAVIGLVIVLSAWIGVDFVMKLLYVGNTGNGVTQGTVRFGPWEDILEEGSTGKCLEVNRNPGQLFDGTNQDNGDGTGTGAPTDTTGDGTPDEDDTNASVSTCPNCQTVPESIPHKSIAQNGCSANGGFMGVVVDPPVTSCQANRSLLSKLQQVFAATGRDNVAWSQNMRVNEMWPPTYNHACRCHAIGTCVDVDEVNEADKLTSSERTLFIQAAQTRGLNAVWETSSGGHFSVYLDACDS